MRYLLFGWRNCRLAIFVIPAILMASSPVLGQDAGRANRQNLYTPHQSKKSSSLGRFFVDIRDDFTYLIGQQDFYQVVGGVGVAPLVFKHHFDTESPEFNEQWGPSRFADNFFELGDGMGNVIYPISAMALFYSFGGRLPNTRPRSFASDLLRAHLFNGLITVSMKGLINRTRPNGAPYSYPSGHTSTAFTSAGVVYYHYGPRVGVPAFIAASYVGFSRLQEDKHYLSDIVAGAVLGTYVSYKITHRSQDGNSLRIQPSVVSSSPGITASLRF